MKKINLIIYGLLAAGMILSLVLHFTGKDKIAYVETNVILQNYEGFKAAQKEYEQKAAANQANVDTLIADWKNELRKYEKDRRGMTSKEKELAEELLHNKQMQLNQYQEAMKMKSKDDEQKLMQTVLNEVNAYIKEYGEKHHYTYILGATGSGNIVHADEKNNITQHILDGLNEQYRLNHGITLPEKTK